MAINIDITPTGIAYAILLLIIARAVWKLSAWFEKRSEFETAKLEREIRLLNKKDGEDLKETNTKDSISDIINYKLLKMSNTLKRKGKDGKDK